MKARYILWALPKERPALNELVYELGKVAAEMGEDWRLKHVELMDAFEYAQAVLDGE